MARDSEKGVGLHFLAGIGLGALVGAIAALLLAPKSGAETRQEVSSAAEELREKAAKMVQDLSKSSEELVKKSKELIETTKEKVQCAVESGKQAMARKKADAESEESEA